MQIAEQVKNFVQLFLFFARTLRKKSFEFRQRTTNILSNILLRTNYSIAGDRCVKVENRRLCFRFFLWRTLIFNKLLTFFRQYQMRRADDIVFIFYIAVISEIVYVFLDLVGKTIFRRGFII